MIRFMEGRGAIASNPTANVRIHFSKSKPSDEEEACNIPTVDEARHILAFCKERASSPNKRQRLRWKKWHAMRSEEHTSELQSLMRISYAIFCLKKKILRSFDLHIVY